MTGESGGVDEQGREVVDGGVEVGEAVVVQLRVGYRGMSPMMPPGECISKRFNPNIAIETMNGGDRGLPERAETRCAAAKKARARSTEGVIVRKIKIGA